MLSHMKIFQISIRPAIFSGLCLLFSSFFSLCYVAEGFAKEQNLRPNFTLNLAQKTATLLNKKKYGFNQEAPPLINLSFAQLASTQDFTDLNIRLYRFPGGTNANFYQWQEDRYEVEDLRDFPEIRTKFREELFRTYGRNGKKVGFESFLQWAKRDGVTPLFTINMNTEKNFENILKAFRTAEEVGVKVEYCELGNELYFPDQAGEKYKKIDNFIAAASDATLKLKRFSPAIKIGIPVAGKPGWNHGEKWDQAVSRSNIPFDAIVLHNYLKVQDVPEKYVGSEAYTYVRKNFPEYVHRYTQMFPGKKIWLSEWNIGNKPQCNINQTFYGTLYAADFFLYLLREQAIDIAAYHRLMPHTHSIFVAKYSGKGMQLQKTFPYFFWKIIGQALLGSTHQMEVEVSTADGNKNTEQINAISFYNDKKIYVLLLNLADNTVVINSGIEAKWIGKITSLSAERLPSTLEGSNINDPTVVGEFSNSVSIKPFSINLLEWSK